MGSNPNGSTMTKLGKHKSIDKDLRQSINWLKNLDCVDRVILGFCEAARHKYTPGTLRYKSDVRGGIKLNAYGGNGVIDIYVKTTDVETLTKKLRGKWKV